MDNDLIKNSIYQKDAKSRRAEASEWQDRNEALSTALKQKSSVFDSLAEQAFESLIDLLGWHRPWQHWEQVFEPLYIGDRYLGQGCRICGVTPNGQSCYSVRVIAARLSREPSDLTALSWPQGRPAA